MLFSRLVSTLCQKNTSHLRREISSMVVRARKRISTGVTVSMLLFLSAPASAGVIWAGSGCATSSIQTAIDVALQSPGADEVRIVKGTGYSQIRLNIQNQDLKLSGGWNSCNAASNAGRTRLSGQGASNDPVLRIRGMGSVELVGLEIANGNADAGEGGGIDYRARGSLTLRKTVVEKNSSVGDYVAGIRFEGSGGNAILKFLEDVSVRENNGRGITVLGTAQFIMSEENNFVWKNTANGLVVLSPASATLSSPSSDPKGVFYDNHHAAILAETSAASNANSVVRIFSKDVYRPFRIASNRGPAIEVHSESPGPANMTVCAKNIHVANHSIWSNYGDNGNLFRVVGQGAHLKLNGECEYPAQANLRCPRLGEASCNVIQGNTARPNAALVAVLDGGKALLDGVRITGNSAATVLSASAGGGTELVAGNVMIDQNKVGRNVIESKAGAALSAANLTIAENTDASGGTNFTMIVGNNPASLSVSASIVSQDVTLLNAVGSNIVLDKVLSPTRSGTRNGLDTIIDGWPNFFHGSYRLAPNAVGVDWVPAIDGVDLDGNPRSVDNSGRVNTGGTRDLGALETEDSNTIRIATNGTEPYTNWKEQLKAALLVGGKTILLAPEVDLDLSGENDLYITAGTTLKAEVPRSPKIEGPRLFTRTRPKPLFHIRCLNDDQIFGNDVTISGFRLFGPHFDSADGDDNLERGIMVNSCRRVVVSNMELAGWSGQAVYVKDPMNYSSDAEDVIVRDSFIHHNQHDAGNGYGVESKDGARVLIERNVFDYNRHAIAAGGEDGPGENNGTGYVARNNLVLRGGGNHYTWFTDWRTHQFDVHGTEDCYNTIIGDFYEKGCGQAGEAFEFSGNAFQYDSAAAIKLRGHPTVLAIAIDNVFAAGSQSDAIVQNDGPGATNLVVEHNNYDEQTFGRYGVCDFDADGRDDLFLATGLHWWYSSGGKSQWTLLKMDRAKLDEVSLGDFDADGRCDVMAGIPFNLSSGGTGDWVELQGGNGAEASSLLIGDMTGDGRPDVFRPDAAGQWWIMSPGVFPWTAIGSSGLRVKDLRLGDFNGDGVDDVLSVQNGQWAVSWSGTSQWDEINGAIGFDVSKVIIGDIDHNGVDDIIRYQVDMVLPGHGTRPHVFRVKSEVSWDGRSGWTQLLNREFEVPQTGGEAPSPVFAAFTGRFRGENTELLEVSGVDRKGRVFDIWSGNLSNHSRYSY